MMPSMYGSLVPSPSVPGYHPDIMLDDWSRQMLAAANSRRFSRGSNGQRSGGAMRVVKPTSASNSPRSSMLAARRRTVVNDGMGMQARIRQQLMDQALMTAALGDAPYDNYSESTRSSSRPVSWHPGTNLQQQFHHQLTDATSVPSPACYPADSLSTTYAQFSPVPAAYSCQTSPVAFSPLSLPFADYQSTPSQCLPVDDWSGSSQATTMVSTSQPQVIMGSSLAPPEPCYAPNNAVPHEIDWNTFAAQGFDNVMPPTPESFPPMPQPEPAVTSEDYIPYSPLEEDDEEEGEILVGMGLYDTPEKDFLDTGLDNYHTTTSHLLGATRGKGLKLLEAWQPPASDDEDEDEDEDDDGTEDP
ncbi:hypothetical protein MKZ38_000892 [Zalerion maritima]|uniref:Uncharacterized protein n=1 Tax=Zalerion maritima TaxID=339359 RepID=A0AAD5WXM3_9PEZI|nr:hypothetical protein MKZ38_000892 [Zalerion maritima]